MGNYSIIDSFSGAGGLLLGMQDAGYTSVLSFDNDPVSVETQKINSKYFHHDVECQDVNELIKTDFLAKVGLKRGDLFLLAGGPPCQGFSIQRIGRDKDDRNDLVKSYARLVEILYPKFFLIENVPGILGKRGKFLMEETIEQLSNIGYQITHKTIDAQNYGVPQRRRRVVFVGIRNDIGIMPFSFPKPSKIKSTVRDTIGHLPEPPLNGVDHPNFPQHRRDKLSKLNIQRLAALLPGQGRDHLPEQLLATCHKISSTKIGHRNVYGRMAWNDVAPTITARFDSFTRGLFGHPEQLRSISLREGALLQTFPSDFRFAGTKVQIARQIGNAVPPKLAYALGKAIISYYEDYAVKEA